MSTQWSLPKSTQPSPIGEFKGKYEDCYRSLRTTKEEINEVRFVHYNSETILVYYPVAVSVHNQFVYACEIMWKDNKGLIDSKKILVGDINEDLLRTDRNYFNCLKELLEISRIHKYIEAYKANGKRAIYVGSIKKIEGMYRKYMDENVMYECNQSNGLLEKQEKLNNAIEEYNNQIYERPDYRGHKR